jgi:hypothetical protein
MLQKPLLPDHYWALVTMDQEGGLDMSFWENHEDAKKALFHWWTFGEDESKEEIAKLSDNEQQDALMRYCFTENVFWWIVPARILISH